MAVKSTTQKKTSKKSASKTPFEASSNSQQPTQVPYTEKEAQYRGFLLAEIEKMRNMREQPHDEFNGMAYTPRYIANFKAGNSYTPPRKNPEETSVVTGTTREKKLAIINAVLNLVFETSFRAFDQDNIEDQELGEAFSDCVFQSNKIEQWDEHKIFAYSELADQGDVFIEDTWVDETRLDKKKIKISDLNEEVFKDFNPESALKVVYSGPRRRVIPGPQVFLGNIRETNIRKQPRIFTRVVLPFEEVRGLYGHLPRFDFVPRKLTETNSTQDAQFGLNWRCYETQADFVEVLIYQDKPNDEFQIFLNGVMMLPVGFPMPWEHGEYSITQGHLEPISAFFAYSKSIPDKTKLDQEIIDEMYRLAVLKTQKSFMPPIANYSANLLTKNMFYPGKINNDLMKGDIEVLGGNPNMYAMTQSEFEMIQMIKKMIDDKSVNPALQGVQTKGETTATEYTSILQQAKLQLGVMIFGFMNLHLNLDYLRLMILLENYTKENGEKYNEMTEKLERKFASVTTERQIGNRGVGIKRVEFTENPMDPMALYDMEEGITRNETGVPVSVNPPAKPVKITQIKPSTLRSVRYRWYPEITVNQRESSMAERINFEDRLVKAGQIFGVDTINWDYAKQQWSVKNQINPNFFFTQQKTQVPQEEVDQIQETNVNKINRVSPTGQQAATRQGIGVT